jgi:ATP synthase protein I
MIQVLPVLLWQVLVTLGLALVFLFVGTVEAYSAILGGLICVIPNAYLAGRLLLKSGAGDSRVFLRAAFTGEAIKLVLTGALFVLVFKYVKPLNVLVLFIGFITAITIQWLGLIFIGRDRTEKVQATENNDGE